MPEVITFPTVAQSQIRVTYEIVVSFFNGQVHNIGGVNIQFPLLPAKGLIQQIENLETVSELTLAFLNATITDTKQNKCVMPDGTAGYELTVSLDREVAIVIPKVTADPDLNFREGIKIWDKLFAVFSCKKQLFAERGISNIEFDPIPFQVAHPKLAILTGSYRSVLHARHKLN